jgi:hypothetical protein
MINIRTQVQSYLTEKHSRVYYQVAPDNAIYPYIVYDIVNIFDDGENTQLISLDIDGWDDESNTTALETLMQTIDFNKLVLTSDDLSVIFYLENKIPLRDDEEKLNRRKYTYTGRLFERS